MNKYAATLTAYHRRHRAIVLTFIVAASIVFLIGIFATALIRPQFEASATLAPQRQMDESSPPSSVMSSLSGLSSFTSIFQGDASENLVAFQQLVSTAELADALIKNQPFMKIAFPSGRAHRSFVARLVRGAFGRETPATIQPSDVQDFLTSRFYLQKLTAPDYIEVSYSNPDRQSAITALRIFLATSDGILRGRERVSLARQISYLSDTIRNTTDVNQSTIFRQLLEQKLSAELLLDTQPTYAFRIFDAPDAPAVQTVPNLSIMLAIAIVASLVAGCLAVFARALLLETSRASE